MSTDPPPGPRRDPDGRSAVGTHRPAAGPPDGQTPVDRDRAGWLGAVPGVARIAAGAAWRLTGSVTRAWVRTGGRMARAVMSARSPAGLLAETGAIAREEVQHLLGVTDPSGQPARSGVTRPQPAPTESALQERGRRLLERSADVNHAEPAHPAYARILEDLAADEARILRLLVTEGPQPSVDVRTAGLLPTGTDLVAAGLTMIGPEAGCRDPGQVPAYLNNLERLGLIWFSRESVDDLRRYQVLEAQPAVLEAMEQAGRARTVRRSIHLTPFGRDFCRVCLPVEGPDEGDEDREGAG